MNTNPHAVCKILGALFYYSPNTTIFKDIIKSLTELSEVYGWEDKKEIEMLTKSMSNTDISKLEYDYSVLFEGQGTMPAPPWGSVYLSPENLLMDESAQKYRAFLSELGLSLTAKNVEPDDQFGLMLMATSLLLEKGKLEEAKGLLTTHLLPWAYRYLEVLEDVKLENYFYNDLAKIAKSFLISLEEKLSLKPTKAYLYF